MVDNHCRPAHLCCQYSIAWNSQVFPPLHPVSGRHTRRHIGACIVCGMHINAHCRSVKFLMNCLVLSSGDYSPNFELWCLVLSVELVLYIQRSQLQPVLPVSDSIISILLKKQQYQLSEFSFPSTWQWPPFSREAPKVGCRVWERGHFANSWSYDGSILKYKCSNGQGLGLRCRFMASVSFFCT